MKIAVAQLNMEMGDFEGNLSKMHEALIKAKENEADLIVFGAMAICGYHPQNLLLFNDFKDAIERSLEKVRIWSEEISILITVPAFKNNEITQDIYYFQNAEIVLQYGVFNCELNTPDKKFSNHHKTPIIHCKKYRFALILDDMSSFKNLDASICDAMIHWGYEAFNFHQTFQLNALWRQYKLPILSNQLLGSDTQLLFQGKSIVLNAKGECIYQAASFSEEVFDIEFKNNDFVGFPLFENHEEERAIDEYDPAFNISLIYDALIFGIKEYFQKNNFHQAVVGSSGGLDSAVVLALTCAALGSENVTALLMPSPYSTEHSVNDAKNLSQNLQNPYFVLPIQEIYESGLQTLNSIFKDAAFDTTEENIQARIRGLLLMAYSNKKGAILLNTSNKSEAAVGYGTLYGDMNGSLSVIGDLYKTQVYALARYINKEKEIIPEHIIQKPPSAELRPDQKDADSLPDYSVLDSILYQHIELQKDATQIIEQGEEPSLVHWVLNRVKKFEFKRFQFCPILKINKVSFGIDWKMPLGHQFFETLK